MATHRRNWNSDFENYAQDLLHDNKDFFTDEAVNVYEQLTEHANDEIDMLSKRILELEDLNEDLLYEKEELSMTIEVLEEQLNEWEMND